VRWLADRLARLRWMAVPVAAYLAITLGLPLANGAAARPGFAGHAAWVVAGCAAIVLLALLAGAARDLAAAGARRIARRIHTLRLRGGDPAGAPNNRVRPDVVIPGGRA
jgi:hypothetical protein